MQTKTLWTTLSFGIITRDGFDLILSTMDLSEGGITNLVETKDRVRTTAKTAKTPPAETTKTAKPAGMQYGYVRCTNVPQVLAIPGKTVILPNGDIINIHEGEIRMVKDVSNALETWKVDKVQYDTIDLPWVQNGIAVRNIIAQPNQGFFFDTSEGIYRSETLTGNAFLVEGTKKLNRMSYGVGIDGRVLFYTTDRRTFRLYPDKNKTRIEDVTYESAGTFNELPPIPADRPSQASMAH